MKADIYLDSHKNTDIQVFQCDFISFDYEEITFIEDVKIYPTWITQIACKFLAACLCAFPECVETLVQRKTVFID